MCFNGGNRGWCGSKRAQARIESRCLVESGVAGRAQWAPEGDLKRVGKPEQALR
ncbi:MAG TPA: hypothetical protein IAC31_08485 [Candidatus Faecousia intestinigallinarum]|nr:hypothetical protein [Candidatus Faecousia intestinigallinarum]